MTVKWSAFTAGSAIAGTDTTVGLQSSANVKWTFTQAATFFWASPALVTPALGTPASGVLSSCTGLPLTTGITGTLGTANGGTGVANNAASTIAISGNFATTLTVSGITGVTLPTTGTLATLAGSEALTNKSINGMTVTASTGTFTLTNGKVFSVSNTLTFTGTDSSSIAFGGGGTVAYTNVATLSSLASIGTITTGDWNAGALTSSGLIKNVQVVNTSTSVLFQRWVWTGDDNWGMLFYIRHTGSALVNDFKVRSGSSSDITALTLINTGEVNMPSTTASTTTTSGALTVGGGLGVAGAINGANIKVAAAGALTLGNAATTGLTAGVLAALTNATIVISDSTGQAYRIPCII